MQSEKKNYYSEENQLYNARPPKILNIKNFLGHYGEEKINNDN